jgi:D-3-phosphoglycerate dehydrogenase
VKKVLLIDTIHNVFCEILEPFGFVFTDGSEKTKAEIISIIHQYDGIVIRSRFKIDKNFIGKAVNLKFIARAGAGLENIDIVAAESKGIICINAPEGNRDAVGEHALAMLLSLLNRINIADKEVRAGKWIRHANRSTELLGKTIGIVGFGNMGQAFANRLNGFGVNVLVYDKYKNIDQTSHIKQVSMEQIFNECDVLSLHVPLTEETENLVNDNYISSFRKNIYIINTARGKVINTASLVNAIKSGKVSGACLDVVEYESVSFEEAITEMPDEWKYLIESDKTILTPHIAGWSIESHRRISEVMAEKVKKVYAITAVIVWAAIQAFLIS